MLPSFLRGTRAPAYALISGGGGGGSGTTLNPSTTPAPGTSSNITVSGADLVATATDGTQGHATTLGSAPSGQKVYWEATLITKPSGDTIALGVCNSSAVLGPGGTSWIGTGGGTPHNAMGIYDSGAIYLIDNSNTNDFSLPLSEGDTLGFELDVAASSLKFRKGSYLSAAYTTPSGTLFAYLGLDATGASVSINTGASAFVYAADITSGYTGRLT